MVGTGANGKYAIVTDSTADLTKELRQEYGIDYVQMNITFDGKELPASLDWDVYSAKELYDWLRNGKRIKTTQVPYTSFYKCFEKYLSSGKDVLYIACSSALSGSVNLAVNVGQELREKYPNNKVVVVDSLISCMGQGILVLQAAENRKNDMDIDKNARWIYENRLKSNQIAYVETLEYLSRAGRVKASKAFFGNLFGVKPILISDIKGNNYAFKKIKGRLKALDYLVEFVRDNIVDPENQYIYISHGDDIDTARYIEYRLKEQVKCKGVVINYLGPIIGISTGPGTIGIYFMGKEVTLSGE